MIMARIRGGVHPRGHKHLTSEAPIEALPCPAVLHIPLQQHVGAPAEPLVRKGQRVRKWQLLAIATGPVSAPVHAPTSGTIAAIGGYPAPHPSGLRARTISLKADGRDTPTEDLPPPLDPETATPDEIADRVADCGIVGLGGATFPSAVKLNLRKRFPLHTLVINGAECEPYLTCDDRVMRERTNDVLDGVRIMARGLAVSRVIIAIESNKPKALSVIRTAVKDRAKDGVAVDVVAVPTRYPMGSEKHLVLALTGRETPAQSLTAEIGYVVHNAATALAVHEAVRLGRPLTARVITVSGGAIKRPANLLVPIGTLIADVIEHCGGFTEEPARLLTGGPMMGQPLASVKAPVIKGLSGIIALTAKEAPKETAASCIRCGSCVAVCPCGLVPLEMTARIRKEDLQGAVGAGLLDCLGCGSCSYVCPSHIPLIQYFNYAKGSLTAQQRAQHKMEEAKRLSRHREERLAKQAEAKRAALAKRKAAQAAGAKGKAGKGTSRKEPAPA